jgi:hypothetical protein
MAERIDDVKDAGQTRTLDLDNEGTGRSAPHGADDENSLDESRVGVYSGAKSSGSKAAT